MAAKISLILFFCISIPTVLATYRYYSNYLTYGTGDTMVTAYHGHGGSKAAHRKWITECLDGEAMVGIHDFVDDFEKIQSVWCKFMFPNKPPSQGIYPYYPSCHVRDFGVLNQQFCFDAKNASQTINTFITGFWDNEFQFWVYRPGTGIGGDNIQPFKCCKTPQGYYVDYVSCYYQPTHDVNWEYYDSATHIIVSCRTGFVMTGISKRRHPWDGEVHIEWIQCCRVGFGAPVYQESPVIDSGSGRPAYYAAQPVSGQRSIPPGYQSQYRSLVSKNVGNTNRTRRDADNLQDCDENYNVRYGGKGIPVSLRARGGQLDRSPILGVSA